jgi:hypothetical protein
MLGARTHVGIDPGFEMFAGVVVKNEREGLVGPLRRGELECEWTRHFDLPPHSRNLKIHVTLKPGLRDARLFWRAGGEKVVGHRGEHPVPCGISIVERSSKAREKCFFHDMRKHA